MMKDAATCVALGTIVLADNGVIRRVLARLEKARRLRANKTQSLVLLSCCLACCFVRLRPGAPRHLTCSQSSPQHHRPGNTASTAAPP
jgi:hypothetical protein